MKILITSGGTIVPIDDARHIGNMSSGRFGAAIALAAIQSGHDVTFLHAKKSENPFVIPIDVTDPDYDWKVGLAEQRHKLFAGLRQGQWSAPIYRTFEEYDKQVMEYATSGGFDVIMLPAAVSDYAPKATAGKISSDNDELNVKLFPTAKVIQEVRAANPSVFLVGFKLLSNVSPEELKAAMLRQIRNAGTDLTVGNDLWDIKHGNHKIWIMSDPSHHAISQEITGPDDYKADVLIQIIEERHKLKQERKSK